MAKRDVGFWLYQFRNILLGVSNYESQFEHGLNNIFVALTAYYCYIIWYDVDTIINKAIVDF